MRSNEARRIVPQAKVLAILAKKVSNDWFVGFKQFLQKLLKDSRKSVMNIRKKRGWQSLKKIFNSKR